MLSTNNFLLSLFFFMINFLLNLLIYFLLNILIYFSLSSEIFLQFLAKEVPNSWVPLKVCFSTREIVWEKILIVDLTHKDVGFMDIVS